MTRPLSSESSPSPRGAEAAGAPGVGSAACRAFPVAGAAMHGPAAVRAADRAMTEISSDLQEVLGVRRDVCLMVLPQLPDQIGASPWGVPKRCATGARICGR